MNNIKLLWSFLIVCLLAACYDDKGNYDYMEKLSINVSGIEDDHTVLLMDTIKFRPEITPADNVSGVFCRKMDINISLIRFLRRRIGIMS